MSQALQQNEREQIEAVGWNWDNSYARLPEILFQAAVPESGVKPEVVVLNTILATELGLDFSALSENGAARLFSGQLIPPGAQPIAQAYAGHQYGGFTLLGDGRAILLGEHLTPSGTRFDIQFKGSGRNFYSRRGDGRAVLGPMLREYIISEAMHALGIPTTRSLAVVTTGETVQRERALPGAILTRVAASHIRVGTFQFLAAQRNDAALKQLADYTIARHFPEISETEDRYLEFLRQVAQRQAQLIAQWQLIGFVHGVMNTDNMAISGESIDFGPCAFMEAYHPDTVFSSIDEYGRYAYGNQPKIAQWNLARFAETLLTLIDANSETAIEKATEVLTLFATSYQQAWLNGMRKKLGLSLEKEEDLEIVQELLGWMQDAAADFTNTFRELSSGSQPADAQYREAKFEAWYKRWQARSDQEQNSLEERVRLMQSVNPYLIPRNHRVEAALAAAQDENDLKVLHQLLSALRKPFDDQPEFVEYCKPAPPDSCGYRTYCGT
jgi:serine/tyrosine/threonine adenylyltransferase